VVEVTEIEVVAVEIEVGEVAGVLRRLPVAMTRPLPGAVAEAAGGVAGGAIDPSEGPRAVEAAVRLAPPVGCRCSRLRSLRVLDMCRRPPASLLISSPCHVYAHLRPLFHCPVGVEAESSLGF
jgi:hypothetical protein